jgi:hypothetical protein
MCSGASGFKQSGSRDTSDNENSRPRPFYLGDPHRIPMTTTWTNSTAHSEVDSPSGEPAKHTLVPNFPLDPGSTGLWIDDQRVELGGQSGGRKAE